MSTEFKSFRDSSKTHWGRDDGKVCEIGQINCGSLQRIADASELMAGSYANLIEQRDRYKRYYEEEQRRRHQVENTVRGLRGVITKLKVGAKK